MANNAWAEASWVVKQLKSGSGSSGGIAPSTCKSVIAAKGKNLAINLTYTWPDDTTIDGQVLVSVAGCYVRLFSGSDSISGVKLAEWDHKVKNEYSVNPFTIDGSYFVDGQTYTIQVYPYSDQGVVSNNTANAVTFTASYIIKFGYCINPNDSNPATRVSYPADADNAEYASAKMNYSSGVFDYGSWEDAWFIKNLKPVMLKYDGTVDYELNKNDYTKKTDGTASDVANTSYAGNAMMGVPTVWIKTYTGDDGKFYCYIADGQVDPTYHAYAHTDAEGNIIDYAYMPIYNGSVIYNRLRSISGQSIMNNQQGTTEITYAKANNQDGAVIWHTEVLADRLLINHLLLLIGKSTNTQAVFGNGHYTGGSSASNLLKSGTMNTRGLFWGTNGTGNGVKVFGIENWWGNQWRRIAGYINANGTQKIKLTYGKEDGSTVVGYNTDGSGYIALSNATPGGTSGGYISTAVMNEYGYFPKTASGSETTYDCDGLWFNNGQVDYAAVGGGCGYGFLCGALCVGLAVAVSAAGWDIGASISCKPLKSAA